jgi:hypothetical protein
MGTVKLQKYSPPGEAVPPQTPVELFQARVYALPAVSPWAITSTRLPTVPSCGETLTLGVTVNSVVMEFGTWTARIVVTPPGETGTVNPHAKAPVAFVAPEHRMMDPFQSAVYEALAPNPCPDSEPVDPTGPLPGAATNDGRTMNGLRFVRLPSAASRV